MNLYPLFFIVDILFGIIIIHYLFRKANQNRSIDKLMNDYFRARDKLAFIESRKSQFQSEREYLKFVLELAVIGLFGIAIINESTLLAYAVLGLTFCWGFYYYYRVNRFHQKLIVKVYSEYLS